MTDAAAKAAAVERFLSEFPRAAGAGRDHPALRGCADVAWSEIPGCPPDVAELFFALLDPVAVSEAVRVLTHVLMDSPFHVGAAMPTALPFLLRLAVAADVTVVARLAELAWLAALACAPVGEGEPQPFFGGDEEHPERTRCRAAFAAHADLVTALLDDEAVTAELPAEEEQLVLRKAAGLS